MSHIAGTMPEAKYRSTKKRVQPVRSTPPAHRTQAAHAATVKPAAAVHVSVDAPAVQTLPVNTQKATQKAARKPGEAIASWWPVAVGIFLSGFASEWHTMATQAGIWVLRAAFPLTLLATHREIGIDSQMAAILPQAALYLQLPLEGLLTKLTLDRGKSLKAAIAQLILVHGVATLVLWLLSMNVH
jgi:hypothetical protein